MIIVPRKRNLLTFTVESSRVSVAMLQMGAVPRAPHDCDVAVFLRQLNLPETTSALF